MLYMKRCQKIKGVSIMRDWKDWFKKAGIRAIKTMAQTAIGVMAGGVFIKDINWLAVASACVVAGVSSILMSLAGLPEEDKLSEVTSLGVDLDREKWLEENTVDRTDEEEGDDNDVF